MKRICFIAQFPPPIHGLSKAVDTLFHSRLSVDYDFRKIDITNNFHILSTLYRILVVRTDLFYFTIAQSKGGNWRDLLILLFLFFRRKPILLHLHGGYYRTLIDCDCGKVQRFLNYAFVKKMAGVIVLGDSLKSIFRNLIDKDKIRVVPNCVDDQYLIDNDIYRLKMENLIYKPTLDLLYLSNFMVEKGYRKVLQLALMAKERGEKNLCFHFAGNFFDEKDEQFYWDYIHKYQLDSLVRYHGIVSGGPKKELLALCNVFFLITTYRIEGQPISILEAMGNGMAIITTNHAGIPDIMENNVNGMMVDKKSINLNDIYDYIQQLNNDRSLLINICTRNIENIRNYYTEEQYIDNMNSAFQDVLH